MTHIIVAGMINIETTLRVDGFPLEYHPQHFPFFGVRTTVSGVGYNVARSLNTLGDRVDLLSLIGNDLPGQLVHMDLHNAGIEATNVLSTMPQTPQSVIIYEPTGRRSGFTDLKDIQERAYPVDRFAALAETCDACVLCNTNLARGLLASAKRLRKLVATDVHTIADPDDSFNRDFMAAADILFCSDERLPTSPQEWVRTISRRYNPAIQVIGLGSSGALLYERGASEPCHVSALSLRPVVNTIGAGDALFSAFLYSYLRSGNPSAALRQATIFAAWKVGGNGGADGLLNTEQLDQLSALYLAD